MKLDIYKNEISKKDISRAKLYIDRVRTFFNAYSIEHSNLSKKEIFQKIEDDFVDNSNEYFGVIQRLGGSYVQSLVVNRLLENEQILKDEYQKVKNKTMQKDKNVYYTYDIKKSTRLLIKQSLYVLREDFKKHKMPLKNNDEYTYLHKGLGYLKPELLNSQKRDNITILEYARQFFDKYNILDSLIFQYNKQLKSLWLEDLSYSLDSKNNDKGVNFLLSEENLQTMPSEELAVLNMFWQNKYAKELLNIGFGHFAFRQLNLYDNLPDNNINIDDETIKNLILKYNTLERIVSQIYECRIQKKDYYHIIDNLSNDYDKYFSALFPNNSNDLRDDLKQCIDPILVTKNIYSIKSNLLCATIANFINNKKLKNWGYINDNKKNKPNSIKNNNKYILIGIDYPDLNRPVCIHIDRELLQNIFIDLNKDCLFPIYEGDEDFDINFEHLKTHIVLPLEKSHKVFLRNIPKDDGTLNFNTLLLRHTAFLANQNKFPEHLKQEQNGKKVRIRKYINLFSGETFIEQGKKIVPENVEGKGEK